MILYKYVSLDAGLKIIESNKIGFRQPKFFNDPFEIGGLPFTSYHDRDYRDAWLEMTAILSLTRQPLNELMWAHYSINHTGIVIGFDVSNELFTGESVNIIPVQYGSVIYTKTKPNAEFLTYQNYLQKSPISISVEDIDISTLNLEYRQRLFLYKFSSWSYEEEVRVVRPIRGNETLQKIYTSDGPIYLASLPSDTIQEVYLGLRSSARDSQSLKELSCDLKKLQPKAKLKVCFLNEKNWALDAERYSTFL